MYYPPVLIDCTSVHLFHKSPTRSLKYLKDKFAEDGEDLGSGASGSVKRVMIGGVPHAGKQIIPRDYPEMIQVFLEAQIMIKNRDSCIAPFKFISFESKEKPENTEFESTPGEMRVDATFYLVMGYADGGDLGRYLYSETGVRIRPSAPPPSHV